MYLKLEVVVVAVVVVKKAILQLINEKVISILEKSTKFPPIFCIPSSFQFSLLNLSYTYRFHDVFQMSMQYLLKITFLFFIIWSMKIIKEILK